MSLVKLSVVFATVVIGASTVAIWKLRPRPADQRTPTGEATSLVTSPIKSPTRRPVSRPIALPPSTPSLSGAGPTGETSPTDDDPGNLPQIREMSAKLDFRLRARPENPAWSREARAGIASDVLAGNPTTRLEALDCGDSLCRARLLHDTPEGRQETAGRFSKSPALSGELLFHYQGRLTTVYFAQRGTSLMAMDIVPER